MDVKRNAVITGGVGDIGTAAVKQLSPRVNTVVALDILEESDVGDWIAQLESQGVANVSYKQLDVANYDQCEEVLGEICKEVGSIDYLINNAGITRDAVFTKMTKQQWDAVLRVNLDGMFNVTRPLATQMKQQQFGRIVNVSSVNAQKGQFSQANYAAAKAGIYGFTKSLAQELMASNITVNSISPGYVNTKLMKGIRPDILESIIAQIPAKRLAEPDEIAWAIQFLLDERSAYMTGANLSFNGGLHMY